MTEIGGVRNTYSSRKLIAIIVLGRSPPVHCLVVPILSLMEKPVIQERDFCQADQFLIFGYYLEKNTSILRFLEVSGFVVVGFFLHSNIQFENLSEHPKLYAFSAEGF